MTKMVIDDWLLLTFLDNKEAERALILANWLRLAWEYTINAKLEVNFGHICIFYF